MHPFPLAALLLGLAMLTAPAAATLSAPLPAVLRGDWLPLSDAYRADPGRLAFQQHTVTSAACRQGFSVLLDAARNDGGWSGDGQEHRPQPYRDVAVRLQPGRACQETHALVLRFLVTAARPCSATVLSYASEAALRNSHPDGWGLYVSPACRAQ